MATAAIETRQSGGDAKQNVHQQGGGVGGGEGLWQYYQQRIQDMQLLVRQKEHDLQRLEAQRNDLNARANSSLEIGGEILLPKPSKPVAEENKPAQGLKWSFAPGTNLLSPFGAKIERESKLRLNDFAKELKSFQSVDMSGRNFGDEGLFFLAKSLTYNQTAEDVNFAANGITAEGIKAFDGILQSNIALKSLDLSGNSIGDEGVKPHLRNVIEYMLLVNKDPDEEVALEACEFW